jgi:LmbE family N-acetylglucosaminyl deacetylase
MVLRFAAPLPKIERFQRFLFLGPHPDDIEIGAGATAAKLAAGGKEVCFLVCTDGRFGTDHAPANLSGVQLAKQRRKEAEASASLLGVRDLRFLDFSDGGFYDRRDLQNAIAAAVSSFRPDVIFAPDPASSSECHTDHLNVGEAARRVAVFAPNPGIMGALGLSPSPVQALAYYMTAKPNQYVDTRGYLRLQLESIYSCHKSQFPKRDAVETYLRLRAADFGLRSFKGCAEGFRVLGQTQMHCLPEAGL